jgi:RNA recognition motif-containing protein
MPPMPPMMPPYGYPPIIPPPMSMMNSRPPPMMPPMGGGGGGGGGPNPGYNLMNVENIIKKQTERAHGGASQPTTVFIGNISERAPDGLIKQMLQRCGSVLSWKRAIGTNHKLQAFGFCEYDSPDATLRCIRLMNQYEIADKKLLVKVDQKTRELLGEHIKRTRLNNDKVPLSKNAKKAQQMRRKDEMSSSMDDELTLNLELVDEDTLKEDRIVLSSFDIILKQYSRDLMAPVYMPSDDEQEETNAADSRDETTNNSTSTTATASPPRPLMSTASSSSSLKTVRWPIAAFLLKIAFCSPMESLV